MNRFKLFKNGLDLHHGFIIQLKNNSYWWIPDLYCSNYCDIPEDFVGWGDDGGCDVGDFIGYITFKEFDNE